MSLLRRTFAVLALVGALAAPAMAQDAPEGGRAPRVAEAIASPAADDTAELTPEQERARLIQKIKEDFGLPAQRDTGTLADDEFYPQSASTTAPWTDAVLRYINAITIIFTALILFLMTFFAIRYRSRSVDQPDPENVATHSTTLELTWTVIPVCIVLIMFVLGFRDYLSQAVPPPNADRIEVNAMMWSWSFRYPNGKTSKDLHLPAGRPVQFAVSSSDVLHSFFIPAFRIKKDVVPGRINTLWTEPTTPGIYEIFCTEYCGTNHSRMIAKCFVYPEESYEGALAWITNIYDDPVTGKRRPPEVIGRVLYEDRGCIGCHSTDGTVKNAPTWRNLYGSPRTFTDGSNRVANDEYIRQSILQPSTQLIQGYGASMPSYAGQLSEDDIRFITAYIRSISENAPPDATTQPNH